MSKKKYLVKTTGAIIDGNPIGSEIVVNENTAKSLEGQNLIEILSEVKPKPKAKPKTKPKAKKTATKDK